MRKIKAFIFRNDKSRCRYCGNILKEYEKEYYGWSCEKCEKRILKKCYMTM